MCREIGRKGVKQSLKQSIVETCDKRNDDWAEKVRFRGEGTLSDLHAADARYHVDCRVSFLSVKSVAAAATKSDKVQFTVDIAFETLVALINDDSSKIWNPIAV